MDVKRDILWRVYLCFIGIILLCAVIIGKAFYIQQVQGAYWEGMSDSLHQKIQEIAADRGTIYSDDKQMLSTSIPQFDIYIDFDADGLREKNGKRFKKNIDSLSIGLANLFKDKTADAYKQELLSGYKREVRYYPLKKNVGYRQYQALLKLPLVREGRNKSGFIPEVKNIRLNPYQMLAFRTIGLNRENSQNVGIEATYDSVLKGTPGKRLVRFIAGGVAVPVDESADIEPQNGKDIISTIDTHIQEITENALMKMMISNQAQHGTAIVIETKTGQIKAIANLGRQKDGSYWEDLNYAIMPTEPGSIFKLATMLSLLEDKKVTLDEPVNLEGGHWTINGRTVNDAEDDENANTVLQAFEASSNVGMAKLVYYAYKDHPEQFINHIKKLGLGNLTGVDIMGERHPFISTPGSKVWSATTLPWMAFGYNNLISPLGIAMLYNAIANNGAMLKPYLVSDIMNGANVVKHIDPVVTRTVADSSVVKLLQQCLYGVCNDPHGTGYTLLKDLPFKLCGKTGTALVANGSHGYADKIYQSAFAGYFPADNPQYTCVVEIVNSPHSRIYYGAAVAGPVFKEIAQRLYTLYVRRNNQAQYASLDSLKPTKMPYSFIGSADELKTFANGFGIQYNGNIPANNEWATLTSDSNATDKLVATNIPEGKSMPNLSGFGLKDALYVCENLGLKVNIKGVGRVVQQSLTSGAPIARGQLINLQLN
ncbi:peptidoglycan glycosyltransferase [Arachidicoccus ginsenosidimutans]|uniref:penicillin-binding protein n=1 Tax=Arachidicoccus sp. BS20 TaxID=1850526 RepID=UPI0007F08FDF|nr:penicillin-binding protein [Arachidicoccus sp. BS20]ANI90340.1 peptidoglycan glycosyltransferase [Arachidicoccus sp. BS20]